MRARLEVFATPATLTRAEAANDAVAESAVVWVDVDDPEELGRLRGFPYRPHMVVRSGGSGGLHGFWKLAKPISREELASANRKLAAALRGDRQSTNPARVMRVPSLNRKRYPPRWCRIVMCDLARPGYDVEQLCAGLKDPREPVRVARSPYRGGVRSAELEAIDAALNAIPPPVYFARIAGIAVPERGGEVSCPHADHPDRHPSAMVYPNPGEGWCCFSCGAGGGAIHLVSALRGGPTRGLGGAEFWDAAREALGRLSLEIPESLTQEGRSRGREGVRS